MKWITLLFRIGNDVQQKGWYASKTVWFNILTLVGMVAALKGFDLGADDIMAIAAGLSAIGNIGLRFATDTKIGARTVPAEVPVQPNAPAGLQPTTDPERPFDGGTLMG